ncbi:MAG: lipopolysaccharide biosynthesis protein [Clostridia bacterium]|nr:lipopolysaccharide biosynthesis protein [Clostridia bacterium]
MGRRSEIKTGAVVSYAIVFANIIISLLFTPFMIRSFSDGEYGLYQLLGGIVSTLTVMDLGLAETITKYVAKYRAENDQKGIERLVSTCMLLYMGIGLVILVIGMGFYPFLGDFLTAIPDGYMAEAKAMWIILVINLALMLPMNTFPAISNGYEKFAFPRTVNLVKLILRVGVWVLILITDDGYLPFGKAFFLILTDTIMNIIAAALKAWYVFCVLKVRMRRTKIEKDFVKEVFGFSLFVFIAAIADEIFWKIDYFILGSCLDNDLTQVEICGYSGNIISYFRNFAGALSGAFLPRITRMVKNGAKGSELTGIMTTVGRVQFIVLGLMLVGFAVVGKDFMVQWTGNTMATDAYIVGLVVTIPLTLALTQSAAGVSILQATNKFSVRAIIMIIAAVGNIVVSIIFVKWFDTFNMAAVGAGVGTLLTTLGGHLIALNIYYKKSCDIDVKGYFIGMFKGLLPAMLITLVLGFGINFIPIWDGYWMSIIVRAIIVTAIYIVTMLAFGLNGYEKDLFLSPVKKVFRKFAKR